MNDVEMKRNCVDCGQEFTIPPYQQMFYTNRGWELPKRCKACREKKKQERQKKEAEEATRQFEKELSDSPYANKRSFKYQSQIASDPTVCNRKWL